MQSREPVDLERPPAGQLQMDEAMIVGIALTADQPSPLCSIHETDGAVMSQEQMVGDVSDRRPAGIRVRPHDQKQLMLGSGQSDSAGLLLTPVQKPTKIGPKRKQRSVLLVSNPGARGTNAHECFP
jgi:hypothetical protein